MSHRHYRWLGFAILNNRSEHSLPHERPAVALKTQPDKPTVGDWLHTWLTQYPIPHHALSSLMYRLTRARWKPWKRWQIRWVIRRYGVDMGLAQETDPEAYADFNSFFTRALKPTARPIIAGSNTLACPVDGAVSQVGTLDGSRLLQAKGASFTVEKLLGGDTQRAAPFIGGRFATLYLSPRDYHRIHMPVRGKLIQMVYVPGRLFSVSPRTTRTVPELFARNERVVAMFETPCGPMAMVLVGAIFVGNIETVWAGTVAPRSARDVLVWDYRHRPGDAAPIVLEKGQEMGRFNMGSTVIVLFGKDAMKWSPELRPGGAVTMGQFLGTVADQAG
jgi:phosphatidylserine decarboxylase